MKIIGFIAVILLAGCAAQGPILMKETPLRLTQVEKFDYPNRSNLTLQWQSLDGNIRIKTVAPLEESNLYRVGAVYSRCFLRRQFFHLLLLFHLSAFIKRVHLAPPRIDPA